MYIHVHTVDVKKTFPKSFAVPPFNGVRTVKRQNGNGKRPFTVCPFPRASLSARVPLPLSLIGLRYNMEVAKRILTRSKAWERPIAPTVRKKSRRSRPQSSPPRLLSARLTSCGVADVNGSDRGVPPETEKRCNGKRFWKRFFDVYCRSFLHVHDIRYCTYLEEG